MEALLIESLQAHKISCDYNGVLMDGDWIKQYSEIRKMMASQFSNLFGPVFITEGQDDALDADELKALKAKQQAEKKLIATGYQKCKEKIKKMRQDFNAKQNQLTRSGSGKVVDENYEALKLVWGGSPSADRISESVCTSGLLPDLDDNEDDIEFSTETSSSASTSATLENTPLEAGNDQSDNGSEDCKRKGISPTQKFVDNKRQKLEKGLSAAQ